MKKLLITTIISMFLIGCMSSSYVNLSVASHKEKPDSVTVIKKGVRGEYCSGFIGFYGSYSAAVDDALQKVDGANVLIKAKFSRKEMPIFRICVMVEGDAAKL
jgi:hypothetical protein